jgi:hypothetical protein
MLQRARGHVDDARLRNLQLTARNSNGHEQALKLFKLLTTKSKTRMVEVWTLEQDEELRAACERAGGDLSLKKVKWWEELARGFPGSSAKSLQQVSARASPARARSV